MSPSHRYCASGVACLVISLAAWSAGSSLSECFYATLPAVAFIHWLTGAASVREALQQRARPTLITAVGLLAGGVGLAHLLLGWNAIATLHVWTEVAVFLYYLTGVVIVLALVRRSVLAAALALDDRCRFGPRSRRLLCEVLPFLVLAFFAIPYSIAFAQVHRFKMPNLVDPEMIRNRKFEEIEFVSGDGTRLRGWWIPAQGGAKSPRTLVICHGIAGNRSMFLPFVEVGDWLDANVLMLDMRGHGDSAGRTVTFGYREKEDILAALAWARRERPEETREVIGLGLSMGAATLAQAAALADPPFDAVILDSAFTSTPDMTASVIGGFPNACHPWLLALGVPMTNWHAGCPVTNVSPESSMANLRTPVLFLHCRGDWLIPSEHSVRLHERAVGVKRLCVFEWDGHADAFFAQRERYRQEVMEFWSSGTVSIRDR